MTIVFPEGPPNFWDLMTGRVARVVVDVRKRAIPTDLVGGDYVGDPQMRSRMQAWVNTLWQEKDALIDSLQPGAASEQA